MTAIPARYSFSKRSMRLRRQRSLGRMDMPASTATRAPGPAPIVTETCGARECPVPGTVRTAPDTSLRVQKHDVLVRAAAGRDRRDDAAAVAQRHRAPAG